MAMEPSVVAELPGAEFIAAVRTSPELAMVSLRGLARQLRRANARIRVGETETVAARTAHLLLELAERFARADGGRGGDGVVPITQTDLAEWLGATRETTARALAELRRAGVITTARSRITVNDPAALAALARTG
jgi:CRP/FNR family transcriptional regulator, cyclic AMP receptor protein